MNLEDLNLNKEQMAAVKKIEGPVIVFAGAGTGKTKTLTSRIAYMISEGINPKSILAITFTKKATNEMRERVHALIGSDASKVTISTIHALCARILRQTIHAIGYKNNFEIIDDEDSLRVVNEIYKELEISRKYLSPRAAYNFISNYKNGIGDLYGINLTIYKKYQEKLFNANQVDFDDLLLLTEKIFIEQPDYLKYYQSQFKYILVDEFQDTNIVQYNIIKMIAGEKCNIFVVGDDDQSIYSFRGANVLNMKQFSVDFPQAFKVILSQNYRSTKEILRGTNCLISHNIHREKKELKTDITGSNKDVVIFNTSYFEDEPHFLVSEIKSLVSKGYKYKDIAILYRNNVISRGIEKALIEKGIPYVMYGGFQFLRRREIKDVISYLKFIIDPNNLFHFKRIINLKNRGIGDKTIDKLVEYQASYNLSLFDAITKFHETSPSTKTKALVEFKDEMLHLIDLINQVDLVTFYDELLKTTEYVEILKEEEPDDIFKERLDNLNEFKSILYSLENDESIEEMTSMEKLENGFDNIILDESAGTNYDKGGVVLSTVHSVKGLEFKVVFVVALEEGIFPSLKEDSDIEEERRIAYVAFTRAKEKLYLSCVNHRLIYGRVVLNQQSRFITEFVDIQGFKASEGDVDEILDNEPIKTGDHVMHTLFGKGLVVSTDDTTIQVLFEKDHSLRKLMNNGQKIKKIKK